METTQGTTQEITMETTQETTMETETTTESLGETTTTMLDLVALGIEKEKVTAEDLCKLVQGSSRKKRSEGSSSSASSSSSSSGSSSPLVDLFINPQKADVRRAFEEQTVKKYQDVFANIDLMKVIIICN